VTKIDQIEEDLGMSSDVLGMVLDGSEMDLQDRIMDAVAHDESGEEVVEDIDQIIEERKEAVKRVQENFLIEDQFGESELEEVQEIIQESRNEQVGQSEVKRVLELFFQEFDGAMRPEDNDSTDGRVYHIDTPSVTEVDNDAVESSYPKATFNQTAAQNNQHLAFMSVNHPLVKSITEYCLDGDWIDGKTAVEVLAHPAHDRGIRCNFRLGYETADGSDETEEFVSIFVSEDGEVYDEPPETDRFLSPENAESHSEVQAIAERVPSLVERARDEAQRRVEQMAEEAEAENAEAVAIKREHAERYFDNAIETWESRLETYREDSERGKDMAVSIRRAQSELEDLREQRKQEFEALREEESVLPKTPEFINATITIRDR